MQELPYVNYFTEAAGVVPPVGALPFPLLETNTIITTVTTMPTPTNRKVVELSVVAGGTATGAVTTGVVVVVTVPVAFATLVMAVPILDSMLDKLITMIILRSQT